MERTLSLTRNRSSGTANSGSVRRWVLAARPKTLPAGLAPVVIGTAMAFRAGAGHWPSALLCAVSALLIQIGTNYANDYFDFHRGADDEKRLGPLRVTQAGLVTPRGMRQATLLVFLLASAAGGYLVLRGGWPILLLGVFSILFGILYTGGPFPLGYVGLGEVFVLLFFGFGATAGTFFVQTRTLTPAALLAGLGPGLFSTAVLGVNNLRDIQTDRAAGKKTLAVRFGLRFARWEYLFCIVTGGLTPVWVWLVTPLHPWSLAACLTVPAAFPMIRFLFREPPGPGHNRILAGTGRLLLVYALLFSAGW